DALGQLRQHADEAADIETLLALGDGAADDEILDVGGIDAGALDEAAHHRRGQLVRPHPRQRALLGEVKRRSRIAGDDDGLHWRSPGVSAPTLRKRRTLANAGWEQRPGGGC